MQRNGPLGCGALLVVLCACCATLWSAGSAFGVMDSTKISRALLSSWEKSGTLQVRTVTAGDLTYFHFILGSYWVGKFSLGVTIYLPGKTARELASTGCLSFKGHVTDARVRRWNLVGGNKGRRFRECLVTVRTASLHWVKFFVKEAGTVSTIRGDALLDWCTKKDP